ncbi:hypothetical protein JCM3765_003439 [Sporobolomyces pararoseus]
MRPLSTADLIATLALVSVASSHARKIPPTTRLSPFTPTRSSQNPPTLYAFATDQTLLAIDIASGDTRWSRKLEWDEPADDLLLCDQVLLSSSKQSIKAVSPASGKLLWTRTALNGSTESPTIRLACESGDSPTLLATFGSELSERLVPSSGQLLSSISLPMDSLSFPKQLDPSNLHRIVSFGPKRASLLKINTLENSEIVVSTAKHQKGLNLPQFEQILTSSVSGRTSYLWLQDARLFALDIDVDSFGRQSEIISDAESLVKLGFEDRGVSLVRRKDGSATVLRLLGTGEIEQVWQFNSVSRTSRFAASIDASDTVHVARLSWSRTLRLATVDVVSFSLSAEPSSPIFSGQTVSIDLSSITTDDTFSFALHAHQTRKLLPDFVVFFSSPSTSLQAWNGTNLSWEAGAVQSSFSPSKESDLSLLSTANSIEMRLVNKSADRMLWVYRVDEREKIERLAHQVSDTMLSPGRVRADRTSVLKYRNPNLLAIVVSDSSSKLSIHLVSLESGSEVGRIELPFKVDSDSRIGIAMVEDWIVCTYRTTSLEVPMHVLVSTYLSQSTGSEAVLPQSRVFASPRALHVEGFTQTKLGIASRDCLLTDNFGQLIALPRRALNPLAAALSPTKSVAATAHLLEFLPEGKILGREIEVSSPNSSEIITRSSSAP